MKKLVLILAASTALAVSCQKAESFKETETPSVATGGYTFDFIMNGGGFTQDTKADATIGWTEGERVFIFFQPEGEGLLDRYLTMTYNGSSFSAGSSIQYGCLGKGGKLSAVYVPYLKSGVKPVYNDGEWTIDGGDVYYSCATGVSYTVNGANVTATIAMSIPDGYVQFAVPATKAADGDRMSCNTVDAYNCVTLGSDLKFSETPVEGKKMTGHKDGDKVYFWGKKNSVEADKCELTLASSVTGSNLIKSVPSSSVGANNAYKTDFSVPGGHDYVDLGLSVLWATMNVGANKPEDFGWYFSYGNVIGYVRNGNSYSSRWVTANGGTLLSGGFSYDNYYLSSPGGQLNDSFTSGDATYDAARANWGGSWRTPHEKEAQELVDNCSFVFTDNYHDTGVRGIIVTSKVTGYADKSIFFPCAGYGFGDYIYCAHGRYWTTGYITANNSSLLYFDNDSNAGDRFITMMGYRDFGNTIRPVIDK